MRSRAARLGLTFPGVGVPEATAGRRGKPLNFRATGGAAVAPQATLGVPLVPLQEESGAGPDDLEPGWYFCEVETSSADGSTPYVLVDFGEGFAPLGTGTPCGTRLRTVLNFPQSPHAFALLAGNPGAALTGEGLLLRRVPRAKAFFEMFRGIGEFASSSAVARAALRFARDWVTRGRRVATHGLLERYNTARNDPRAAYRRWLELFSLEQPGPDRTRRRDPDVFPPSPRFTILMLAKDCRPRLLDRAIASVAAQRFQDWELRVALPADATPAIRTVVERHARRNARVVRVPCSGSESSADGYNAALSGARGEAVLVLSGEDVLSRQALAEIDAAWRRGRPQLIYVDDDRIEASGARHSPHFKPDWGPDLWLARNVLDGVVAIEATVVRRCGGFSRDLDACCLYDLVLRCLEHVPEDRIAHVAHILHHRADNQRCGIQSAIEAGRDAAEQHARRKGIKGAVEAKGSHGYLLRRRMSSRKPLVDVIIPTRDQPRLLKRCIDSLVTRTAYPELRITVVDNGSCTPEALRYLAALHAGGGATVIRAPGSFNFSALVNRAVEATDGEVICLLNDDIEAITPGWLDEMVANAMREEVGAVGAMLYFPDGRIQHAGVVTGLRGVAAHVHYGFERGDAGYFGRASLAQNYAAVTGACLVVQRSRFVEVGGFDEALAVCYNDVDFGLKLRRRGYANVWTPAAELLHFESASRGRDDTPAKRHRHEQEAALMRERWGDTLSYDPAYNRNLSLAGHGFEPAFPPRPPRAIAGMS